MGHVKGLVMLGALTQPLTPSRYATLMPTHNANTEHDEECKGWTRSILQALDMKAASHQATPV